MNKRNPDAGAPVVVVGAGLAGLTVALELAAGRRVIVLAKRGLDEGATAWAQGGIVGVLGDGRQRRLPCAGHAGRGRRHWSTSDIARLIAEHSADAVAWLVEAGVPFSPDPAGPLGLHLTREGGHAVRRIAHAADATGRAIHEALLARARAHPNIELRERWMARRPGHARATSSATARRAATASMRWTSTRGGSRRWPPAGVVLATGGVGKVYRYTSNPDTATGDGIAMAWRAGCRVGNMEFIQFHPTCLYHPQERSFLITEALRGEGATLAPAGPGRRRRALHAGARRARRTGAARHRRPRDRLRDEEARRRPCLARRPADRGRQGRGLPEGTFPDHPRALPGSWASTSRASRSRWCRRRTTPAAAWSPTCEGRTDLPGLYAVGETTYTGLHGANRLASNSLLECVVLGRGCAERLLVDAAEPRPRRCRPGTRARSRTPTSRWSSRTTGTSCGS